MKLIKIWVVAAALVGNGTAALAADACGGDLLAPYIKDVKLGDAEFCNDTSGACREKLSAAKKRCALVAEIAEKMKAARDFDELDAAYKPATLAQPPVDETSFPIWLEKGRAEEAGLLFLEYKKTLAFQEEAKKSGLPPGKVLTQADEDAAKARNKKIGTAMAYNVARIKGLTRNFGDVKGEALAERFTKIVENAGSHGQGAAEPAAGAVAADSRGQASPARATVPLQESKPLRIDGASVPSPAMRPAPDSAPAGEKSPLVPLLNLGGAALIAAGTIGSAYSAVKAKAEQRAKEETTARILQSLAPQGGPTAESPAPAAGSPAPQSAPGEPPSAEDRDKIQREELGREGINITGAHGS